jgi:hypothetical protein
MGLVFLVVGTALHIRAVLLPAWNVRASQGWAQTTCTIERSEIEEGSDSDGNTTYRADIAYRFTVAGEARRDTRIDFGTHRGGDEAFSTIKRYPVGAEVPCWLDPGGGAVLERTGAAPIVGLVTLLLQLGGLATLYWDVGAQRAPRPRARIAEGVLVVTPRWWRQTLTIGGAAVAGLELATAGVLLFAIGRPASGVLYVALAVAALVLGGHRLGQRLTGLTLTVTPPRLALGERAHVTWQLRAPFVVGRGRGLLVGIVRVWRGSGSDTTKHEHTLHDAHVADLDRAHARRPVELTVPRDKLPTFEVGRAHVTWALAVHVELPRWPDLDLEVPITVEPVTTKLPRSRPARREAPPITGQPRIVLDAGKDARFEPGAPIEGVVGWTGAAPRRARIELCRRVGVVDGDLPITDVIESVDVATLARIGAPSGDGPFRGVSTGASEDGGPLEDRELRELRLAAPAGPVSHRDALLSVSWLVVLVVDDVEVQVVSIDVGW